jgi:hypothetical protein
VLEHDHHGDRGHQQGVAVGRRVLDRHDADAAGAAGAVLDDDRAAERDAHPVGEEPRQRVAGAAGGIREDDADRLLDDLRRRARRHQAGERRQREL